MKTDELTPEETVADGFADVKEVCRFLGIGRTRAYQLLNDGELPFAFVGSRRRIPRRALVEYGAARLSEQMGGAA